MDVMDSIDGAAAKIAAAIGEAARARILYCLMDDRARTSTELAAVADVGTSTASVHLDRLVRARLLRGPGAGAEPLLPPGRGPRWAGSSRG